MKFLTLFFVIFFGINITTVASLPPAPPPQVEKTFAEMFDSVFSVVSRVQATTGIIYERVVPFANLTSYDN